MAGYPADDPNAKALTRVLGCQPQDLPTLPSTAWEISRLTARVDFSIIKLAEIINRDPALATKLLRLANSPMFAPRLGGRVTEVKKAVMMMGTREVSQLALGLSVISNLGSGHPLTDRVKISNLWKHCVAVGVIAEMMAKGSLGLGPDFYVYGLIHDVGKIALSANRPREYMEVIHTLDKESLSCSQAENAGLLVDHAFVGGVLFSYWELDPALAAAARYHHEPWKAGEYQELAGLIALADAMAKKIGILSFEGKGYQPDQPPEWPRLWRFWQSLGWNPRDLSLEDISETLEQQMSIMGRR